MHNLIERPNRHRFLYFVRHGQYVRTDEHPDGELTALGLRQAAAFADRFQAVPFDSIWSSTMYRAEETAQVIADAHFRHLEVARSTLLREKLFPCDRDYYRDASESFRAPTDRLERIEARWLRKSNRERHELVVCHGNLIRAIVMHVTGGDVENWVNMVPHHCGLTRVACYDDDRLRLVSFNDHSFLPDELITIM